MSIELFDAIKRLTTIYTQVNSFIKKTKHEYRQLQAELTLLQCERLKYLNLGQKITIRYRPGFYGNNTVHRTAILDGEEEFLEELETLLDHTLWICLPNKFKLLNNGGEVFIIYSNGDVYLSHEEEFTGLESFYATCKYHFHNLSCEGTFKVNDFVSVPNYMFQGTYPLYYKYMNPQSESAWTYHECVCPLNTMHKEGTSYYKFLQHMEYLCTYYLGPNQHFSLQHQGNDICLRNDNGNVYRSNNSKKLRQHLMQIFGDYDPIITNYRSLRTTGVLYIPAILSKYQDLFGPID